MDKEFKQLAQRIRDEISRSLDPEEVADIEREIESENFLT